MNVIIERVLVISRKDIEEYGFHGHCIHKSVRSLGWMGLKPYITVTKGYYAKVVVQTLPPDFYINQLNASSLTMYYLAVKYSTIDPDQLGLMLCEVDGCKAIYFSVMP